MSLRLRLLLGYGYLVLLLLVMAGSAMLGFLQLSQGIDQVLQENVQSITASMGMIEALERQDSFTLALLLDPEPEQAEELDRFERSFRKALAEARSNITETQEMEILEQLVEQYELYLQARGELLAARPEWPLRSYEEKVLPPFQVTKARAFDLLRVNQEAMLDADRRARQSAIQNGAWLGFLVAVALFSVTVLSRAMQRHVLERLEVLSRRSEAIATGEVHYRLPEEGGDELATVARLFNQALDRHAELAARTQGELGQQRQLLLALAERCERPFALLSLDGTVLVERLQMSSPGRLTALSQAVREHRQDVRQAAEPVHQVIDVDDAVFELELLLAGGRRPTAWLATRTDQG